MHVQYSVRTLSHPASSIWHCLGKRNISASDVPDGRRQNDGSEAAMDDIVVWGKDQAEHDARLKQVMDKAKACGLKFNKGKCRF